MATGKKEAGSAGYFLSRGSRHSASGVFTEVRGPSGGEARGLNREVYKKAAARAGKMLREDRLPPGPKGRA